ncbi:oligosaccharide flippase family protein [uncultured Weissella sp.]|uniref:lipopolysaccharide biosynthesis protein n=1 Tax=uncultured Weissella sp. TaxID=253243 RepID=UPI0025F2D31A|nr:oligosaccharide flippase family protein [uncultured Weissella sp.]
MQHEKSRVQAAVLNSVVASGGQIVNLVLSFVVRTVFIRILGEQFLGLNGLFSNILNILSFSELGIGAAITFSLYKPIAENNLVQIRALMRLYSKIYRLIGIGMLLLGAMLTPFLPVLISGDTSKLGNIYIAFVLYLMNSAFGYFMSYKRSLFMATQEGYINALNLLIFQALGQLAQIAMLLLYSNYLVYLVIQLVFTILSNVWISLMANRRYKEFLKKPTDKVDHATILYLKKNVVGMISAKLGGVVVFGTDNIILSSMVGLTAVGIYANYTMIINGINSIFTQGLSAVTATLGNFGATNKKSDNLEVFFKFNLITLFLAATAAFVFTLFSTPFIKFWLGSFKYVVSKQTLYLIALGFFVSLLRQPVINYTNALGLYWEQRFKPLFEAGVNLIVSLVLVRYFNMSISGVLIGTLASNLLINAWWEPLILFKHGFDSTIQKFLIIYLSELVMVAGILSILIRFSTSLNTMNIFVQLIIFVIIGLILGFGITFFEYVLLRKMKILETTLFKRVK